MPEFAVVCFYYHREGSRNVKRGSILPIELAKDWVKYCNVNYSDLAYHYIRKLDNKYIDN